MTHNQVGSYRQLIPPKGVRRDLVANDPLGVVALGLVFLKPFCFTTTQIQGSAAPAYLRASRLCKSRNSLENCSL